MLYLQQYGAVFLSIGQLIDCQFPNTNMVFILWQGFDSFPLPGKGDCMHPQHSRKPQLNLQVSIVATIVLLTTLSWGLPCMSEPSNDYMYWHRRGAQ